MACDNCPPGVSGWCRDDAALRALVARWHRLTPAVREKILDLARRASER
jgi:hypothetical protein